MSQLERIRVKPDFKRLLLAVAMAAVVVNCAHAETFPAPQAKVSVQGDVVTVGDIFPGISHDAGYVLAPAPQPGTALTLNARDLERVSQAFHIGWAASSGLEQSVVRRDSHEIDRYVITAAVQDSAAKKFNGRKFDVELSDPGAAYKIPAELPATAEVRDLRYDPSAGDFHATLVAPAGASQPSVREQVSGRLYPLVAVPVLKSPLRQGDTISEADIDYIDLRADKVTQNMIVSADHLVGMSPRRAVQALKPVNVSEIVMPDVVKKGDIVVMELRNNGIFLSTQGRALDNGAAGETVRVENPSSNHVIQAVVTGPKAVAVHATDGI